MKIAGRVEDAEHEKTERVSDDRKQQEKWNGTCSPEDEPGDQIGDSDVYPERRGPGHLQARLFEPLDRAHVEQRGNDRCADRGDDGEQRPTPRVEHAAWCGRFDHFLRDQAEVEHHRDVVHRE